MPKFTIGYICKNIYGLKQWKKFWGNLLQKQTDRIIKNN